MYAQQEDEIKPAGPPIKLQNPSFEDTPLPSITPGGWYDCGAPGESPPDIQPGSWRVKQKAYNGRTYLGLVVRANKTWEAVSQRLSRTIEKGNCYKFSLHLCRSEEYFSPNKNNEEENYSTPAKIRIWGGATHCNKKELLAESSLVANTRWLQYNFELSPLQDHDYLTIEAYYNTPIQFEYNGNVMVDNASDILPVSCEDLTKPREEKKDTVAKQPVQEVKILKELEKGKIREGQTIRIDNLYFAADSSRITPPSFPVLDEIFQFLKENPGVVIEIGGHTNNIPDDRYCDNLSTARAKAVSDYLIAKGIPNDRTTFKGYGKRKPVGTNQTAEGRKKNQRVEIKVLRIRNE